MTPRQTSLPLIFTLCCVLPLIAPAEVLLAQEGADPPAQVPRVLVTADPPDALSPTLEEARSTLQGLPSAVSVDASDDYLRGRHDYLEDFLRYQPGLVIQSSQGAEDTHVSSRGSGQNNDDIIGLAILIDGVPINQSDGEAFLHDVDLQSVKYAEVYRGADALRYGSVTLGGAINLVTVTGREADPAAVGLAFGSFGYTQQNASSGWSKGPWDLYAAASDHTLDGYQEHSEENYQKFTLNLGYRISASIENRLYLFYGRLDQNNPAALDKDDLYANPRQTDPEAIQEDWHTRWDYTRLMDRFAVTGKDWTFLASLEWNHRQQTMRSEYESDFRLGTVRFYSDDYAADFRFEWNVDVFGGKNCFTAGVLPTFEPESDSFYENPNGKTGPLIFADRTYYLNLPLFVEDQHYFTKQLSVLAGFQAVYVDRIFRDGYNSVTLGNQSHDDHFRAFNPKFGAAYRWNDQGLIYLNVSRSFQPVSFDESVGIQGGLDGGEVFHHLQAQHAITLELGTRGEAGALAWDVVLYRSWVRHELLALNNAEGVPLGTVNANDTIHQGIESSLEIELAQALFARGVHLNSPRRRDDGAAQGKRQTDRLVFEQTYTLSDFRFDNDAVYGNHRIAGNPVQSYKAELRYEHPCGLYFGPDVEWNIVKYPVDEANTLFADPYALLGFRGGYKTPHGFQVYFEAKNLLDKAYAAYVEPIADARVGDDTDSFSPGNGRAFYGGVSWNW